MRLAHAARAAAPLLLALGLVVSACAESDTGVPHPTDRLDYPVGVTADPSGRVVFDPPGSREVLGELALPGRDRGAGAIEDLAGMLRDISNET